jgi:thioredoxin-related protein
VLIFVEICRNKSYAVKKLLTIVLFFFVLNSYAQPVKLYNPDADVAAAISQGLNRAKAEGKYLFIQIGGNWCPWCIKFHKFCSADPEISALINKSFITLKVNYSKENKNLTELKKLEYPQRFGFPVFVILDADGKRIHTQSSGLLEVGDSYSKKRVIEFLSMWSPDALNPDQYTNK